MEIKHPGELAAWLVPDVPADPSQARFVFILESPHKEELKKKCPAAGTAGKAMARFILGDRNTAFGTLLLQGQAGAAYAIVNVCQVPMQASAYSGLGAAQKALVARLQKMRNPELKSIDAALYAAVLADLKARLGRVNPKAKLIPCGKFARKAYTNIYGACPCDVPHPSFGNWHKKKYKAAMEQLKAELPALRKEKP